MCGAEFNFHIASLVQNKNNRLL